MIEGRHQLTEDIFCPSGGSISSRNLLEDACSHLLLECMHEITRRSCHVESENVGRFAGWSWIQKLRRSFIEGNGSVPGLTLSF